MRRLSIIINVPRRTKADESEKVNFMEKLRVPTPFQYPPFYEKQSTISTVTTSFSQKVTQFPFYYDILKYLNIDALQPWNKKETYIPLLFTCWSESKNLLMEYYRFRERKKANPIMKISIAMLIQSVWWMNNTEVKSIVQFD